MKINMREVVATIATTAVVMTGCKTNQGGSSVNDSIQVFQGDAHRKAICVGLTSVDPASYNGWDGKCPGCDVDAKGVNDLLTKNGFSTKLFMNSAAKWGPVKAAIFESASSLQAGDLLVVMISSHGGQLPDDNGDEKDGMDETLCMWDGQVRDDEVLKMIHQMPPIRLVLINDQCHSEGNFRSMARTLQRTVSLGYWGRKHGKSVTKGVKEGSWGGQLIQFAGCREASYSYGAESGGTWTQNLLGVYKPELTWKQWFDRSLARMPGNQVPQWVEYPVVSDDFRNGRVLR